MRISHQLVPQTGWKFKQGDVWIYGQTWDELLTNVITHRASNKIELGEPEIDIEEQLLSSNPDIFVNHFRAIIKNGH